MSLLTQRIGQIGVNVVERIVLQQWKARWQPIDSVNDDGVDGLIFVEARGEYTGQIIHVQVKCMILKKNKKNQFRISRNKAKLAANVKMWRRIVGAAILVLVDPLSLDAYWVDLRDNTAYSKTQIYVPELNKFDRSSKSDIIKLCGTLHADQMLPVANTLISDFSYLKSKDHLSVSSRAFYKELHSRKLSFKGGSEAINFTREGWKHITRIQRSPLLKQQSFQLLGTIPRILELYREDELRPFPSDNDVDLVRARAFVKFKYRQSAMVSVVFRKRINEEEKSSYSFYTIYEARRNRNVIGAKL